MTNSDSTSTSVGRKPSASPTGISHNRPKVKAEPTTRAMSRSTFVVLLIISLVILLQTYGQMRIQLRNNEVLKTQLSQQKTAFDEAVKVRQQLELIAGETAILADKGNANAVRIRSVLQEQGINISAPQN